MFDRGIEKYTIRDSSVLREKIKRKWLLAVRKLSSELLHWRVFLTADGSMALPALLQYLVQLCEAERGDGAVLCSIVCSRI